MPSKARKSLLTDWQFWGRPTQQPPEGDWLYWLILAGRGWGKTRTICELVKSWATEGRYRRIAIVTPTEADARDVLVKGPAGILAISDPDFRPRYTMGHRMLEWPNGVMAQHFSAEKPDRLRGPNHDAAVCDELAAWANGAEGGTGKGSDGQAKSGIRYTWDMLAMTLRAGSAPKIAIATTPRPLKIIREILKNPRSVVTRGSTAENEDNVSERWLDEMMTKYRGTRLGRQELDAEILDDVPGALWTHQMIESGRRAADRELARVVVAIDPAVTSGADADETGIVVVGREQPNAKGEAHGVVLEDLSCRDTPRNWMARAVDAYYRHHADCIVAEVNNGGDMVLEILASVDETVRFKAVHASRGKIRRAEPAAALYEQGRMHHAGVFSLLEEQMLTYTPYAKGSPDRMDALVWGIHELFLAAQERIVVHEEPRIMGYF